MRDFSWKYFTLTGDVESFMLYKEMDRYKSSEHPDDSIGYDDELAALDDQD
ncbi:YqzL family protein [Paenibacillus nanensis]|uniref:YqzL family protein n=1 Tax=Paenibacillus nanensis TaxID=393251 RepID=A0A3A1V2W6_9BACL|nr:YqzL family protein [Paenibacillus nanensis]RIX54131.1 YqzL family protein [Paenibacillus nanensis]